MIKNRAFTTLEFCVLTALVAAAFIATQSYLKQAIQANWRGNVDSFSDEQYRPDKDAFGQTDPNPSRGTEGGIVISNSSVTVVHPDASEADVELARYNSTPASGDGIIKWAGRSY